MPSDNNLSPQSPSTEQNNKSSSSNSKIDTIETVVFYFGILVAFLLPFQMFHKVYVQMNDKKPQLKDYVTALYWGPYLFYHEPDLKDVIPVLCCKELMNFYKLAAIKAKTDPDYDNILNAMLGEQISLSTNSKIKMVELFLESGMVPSSGKYITDITIIIQQAKMGNSAAITYIDQVFFNGMGINEEVVNKYEVVNEYFASISPPIEFTMCSSLNDDIVVQIQNNSGIEYLANIFVENPTSGEKSTYKFTLSPNELQELGMHEMNWKFLSGQRGYIEVEGYPMKLCFYLKGEQYYHKFSLHPEFIFNEWETEKD